MTVVTANVQDVAARPDNTVFIFSTAKLRESADGQKIVTQKPVRVFPVDGVLTVNVDPGLVEVTFLGHSYLIDVPNSGPADLWDLLQAEIVFDGDTRSADVGKSVSAYLRVNSLEAWETLITQPASAREALGVETIVSIESPEFNLASAGYAAALSSAIDKAAEVGGTVTHKSGKTYTAHAGVVKTDTAVRVDWNGARVVRATDMPNVPLLKLSYTPSTPQAVVGLTNMSFTYSDAVPTTTPSTRIELSSTSGWSAGDYAVIVGDDEIPGANPADAQREGERFKVLAVQGNYIWPAHQLRTSLATNIRIARLSAKDVVLTSPWFEDAAGSPATRNNSMVQIYQAVKPRVVRAKLQNLQCEGFAFFGCVEGGIDGSDVYNIRTDFTNNAFGYGFRLQSCNDFLITGVRGGFLRHLVTTGAQFSTPSNSPDMWRYGSSIGHRVLGGNANEGGHAAFDTHEEAAFHTYDSCYVGWNHREPDGGFGAFKIRGRSNTVKNSTSIGAYGVELSSFEGGGGHHIINHDHTVQPGTPDMGPSYRVNYSDRTSTRGKATISGCRDTAINSLGQRVLARKCRLEMPTHYIRATCATNQWTLFQVEDSEVHIGTLVVDLRDIGAVDPRIFFVNDSASVVRVERLVVLTGGVSWRVAHLNDLDGTVIVGTIETDTLPSSFHGGFTNDGAGSTTFVGDIVLNQKSIHTGTDYRGNGAVTMSPWSSGTQVLPAITADRAITEHSYPAGRTGAEILYVRPASATGAFSWTFSDDSLSAPGTWLRRKWNGTAWETVAKGYAADQSSATQTLSNKTLTAPKIVDGGFIADDNGNEYVTFGRTASAVNGIKINNASTGNRPSIVAVGDDTNIDLNITGQGTGVVRVGGNPVVTTTGSATMTNKTLTSPRISSGTAPATAAATGAAGQIEWDSGFLYVCTATNTWKRVAIATW